MSGIPFQPPRRRFSFGDSMAVFLSQPGLPFANVLTEDRIVRIFARHQGLFGRVYTTALVMWAFMSQILCDGKTGTGPHTVRWVGCGARGGKMADDRSEAEANRRVSRDDDRGIGQAGRGLGDRELVLRSERAAAIAEEM